MNYNNKQLCEIYYLFHEYDQECVKQISNDYPELLNYSNILRMICFQLRIFVGEYPDWYESRYYFTHLPFTITHHNISVYTMSELFKVLAQLKPEQLSFINDDFIRGIGSHYSHLFIDKFKMAVVPSQMVEENTHQYIDDFELMLSDELWNLPRIEYNGLNNIKDKLLAFYRYSEQNYSNNSRPIIFVQMLIAYFYAHLEKYDYNYDNLDLLIQKFQENALDYVYDFDEKYGKRYDLLGGIIVNNISVYQYIESIVDKLLDEKSIIRKK